MIFSVNDNDEVVGLDNPQEVSERISEIITSSMDSIPVFDIRFETIDAKVIIILKIEEGKISPYY